MIGARNGQYWDPRTRKRIDVVSRDALLRLVGRRDPAAEAEGLPCDVSLALGPFMDESSALASFRGWHEPRQNVLSYYLNTVDRPSPRSYS